MAVTLVNDAEFKAALEKNPKVVVKYFADWCGSCKLFSPKFRRLSEEEKYQDVLFLDVNAEYNPEARKMASVDSLPYVAVFKDGVLLQGESTSKEDFVVQMIDRLNA